MFASAGAGASLCASLDAESQRPGLAATEPSRIIHGGNLGGLPRAARAHPAPRFRPPNAAIIIIGAFHPFRLRPLPKATFYRGTSGMTSCCHAMEQCTARAARRLAVVAGHDFVLSRYGAMRERTTDSRWSTMTLHKRFCASRRGIGAGEWTIIGGLLALGVIAAVSSMKDGLTSKLSQSAAMVGDPSSFGQGGGSGSGTQGGGTANGGGSTSGSTGDGSTSGSTSGDSTSGSTGGDSTSGSTGDGSTSGSTGGGSTSGSTGDGSTSGGTSGDGGSTSGDSSNGGDSSGGGLCP